MGNLTKLIAVTMFIALAATLTTPAKADVYAKDKKAYFLYGDARPGSKFKQKLFRSDVPFDKRYSELSPELKSRVKAAYGGLKDSEHPPFPKTGTEAIYKSLHKANLKLRREGDILAIAMVNNKGEVKEVSVYKAPTPTIATILSQIIVNTEFDPATCNGKPCEMEYLFENKLETKPKSTQK